MIDKRGFFRFLRQRKMQYFSEKSIGNLQEGTIIDVSRKGMRILFQEKIDIGSTICLQIPVPGASVPINVNGTLQRIQESGNDFIAGIELTKMLDDEKFRQLLMGYSLSRKKINTKLIKKASKDANVPTEETHLPLISKQHFTLPFFRKVFSLKGAAISFFSLLLLLSLIFSVERGYFPGNLLNEGNQKEDMVIQRKEAPSSIESTEIVSNQLISSADAHLATQIEPVVSREKGVHVAVLKEEGGSLHFLALKHYQQANETLFDLILQANPSITDVRQIHEDQKITLPVITSESYIKKVSDGTYQVYIGTFKTHNLAALYSKKVIDLGKPLIFDSHKFSSEDTWHRLLIGNFKNKEEALKTVTLLKEHAIIYVPPEQR